MPERLPHSSSTADQIPDGPVPKPLQWIKDNSLPITGLLLLVLLLCLIAHYSSIRIDWLTTHAFTGSVQNVVQVFALCAGGCWAYFKFSKGRTFQQSLTPAIIGRFVSFDDAVYLIAMIQIKNVGSSRVDFDRQTSALILYDYAPSPNADVHVVENVRLTSFAIFDEENERCVEPKEDIEVQHFIWIPAPPKLAYRLEAEILSTTGSIWRATAIVNEVSVGDNAAGSIHSGRTE